jgi:cell division protein FtsB
VKTKTKTGGMLRLCSRLLVGAAAAALVTLIAIQFARIVGANLAMAHTLTSVRRDIALLRRHKAADEQEIRRLSDPQGAIPEIHDRLHLVRPNEAIIYFKRSRAPGE